MIKKELYIKSKWSRKKAIQIALALLATAVFSNYLGAFLCVINCYMGGHKSLTRIGLSQVPGLKTSWQGDDVVTRSCDPDINNNSDKYHFLSGWNICTSLLQDMHNEIADITANGHLSYSLYVYSRLGLIMHLTQDFYAHTSWVDWFNYPNLPNFDGGEGLWFQNKSTGGFNNSYDCQYSKNGEEAIRYAKLEATRQFQRYLKEVYERRPGQAEAMVCKFFPSLPINHDLLVTAESYCDTMGGAYNINENLALHWNNYTYDPINIQILRAGAFLGTVTTVSGSDVEYMWKVSKLLKNGNRVIPDTGYQLRMARGTKIVDSGSFEIHGIRCANPVPNAKWKKGTGRTISFRGYRPDAFGKWTILLFGSNGSKVIGFINIDSSNVKDYYFNWIVGYDINGNQIPAGSNYQIGINFVWRDPSDPTKRQMHLYVGDPFSIIN